MHKFLNIAANICWVAIVGWNVIVFSIPLVSDQLLPLDSEYYQIDQEVEDLPDLQRMSETGELRVLIRSDAIAFVRLTTISLVNLALLAALCTVESARRRDRTR